jgi:RND family efflux transporter MFP subunit
MKKGLLVPGAIAGGVVAVFAVGALLVLRAEARINNVPLDAAPKPVTVVLAQQTTFRETRTYVGTLRPWVEANVGPQFISVYVDTVLVRPGAVVKRNEVLATLDCRNASASSLAVAAEARAIDARQKAVADEAARLKSLLDGGFVSPNEAEQKEALSTSEEAQLASQRAKLAATRLEVNDCILRAPFDGEIGNRWMDPGGFARPGTSIVSVIDRSTVRMTFDVPESDFGFVSPGTPLTVSVLATGETFSGTISRRSPSAEANTRTVHVEVDMPDAERRIPVNTTGEVRIEVGQPHAATGIPLYAASISGEKANVFVVSEGDGTSPAPPGRGPHLTVHKVTYKAEGERGGTLFVDTSLKPGVAVVTEGRAIIADGDAVHAKQVPFDATAEANVNKEQK